MLHLLGQCRVHSKDPPNVPIKTIELLGLRDVSISYFLLPKHHSLMNSSGKSLNRQPINKAVWIAADGEGSHVMRFRGLGKHHFITVSFGGSIIWLVTCRIFLSALV